MSKTENVLLSQSKVFREFANVFCEFKLCVCVFFSISVWTKLNQPNWGAISKYMRCVIYRIYG